MIVSKYEYGLNNNCTQILSLSYAMHPFRFKMPDSHQLVKYINDYLQYVQSCPEHRQPTINALQQMSSLAKMLNSCDA